MPPASGFELLAEHIMGLVSEMEALKNEIKELKKQNNNDVLGKIREEVTELKLELCAKISDRCESRSTEVYTRTYADVAQKSPPNPNMLQSAEEIEVSRNEQNDILQRLVQYQAFLL